MKRNVYIFLVVFVFPLQDYYSVRDSYFKKVYTIVQYIKHDTAFINDSPVKDSLCLNVQVMSGNVPVLGGKFMDYLIDSVYYLRHNSHRMTSTIKKSYDSILSVRNVHHNHAYLPAGTYFNNCIDPDYAITFDFYSDSICVVDVSRYPIIYVIPWEKGTKMMSKNYSYLFKTNDKGTIINVLKSFRTH